MKKLLAVAVIAGLFCAYGCQKAMTPTDKAPEAPAAATEKAPAMPAVEKPAPAPAAPEAAPAPAAAPEAPKPAEEAK